MEKYVVAPNSLTFGAGLLGFRHNVNWDQMEPYMIQTLNKYGYDSLDEIDPNQWYPQQLSVDFFKSLAEGKNLMFDLIALGINVIDTTPFPPEVDSIHKAVYGISAVYQQVLRNCFPDEGYHIEEISERHLRVTDNTPWPHDLIYGYFYAIARRFKPNGSDSKVTRTYLNPNDPDSDGAVYDIEW